MLINYLILTHPPSLPPSPSATSFNANDDAPPPHSMLMVMRHHHTPPHSMLMVMRHHTPPHATTTKIRVERPLYYLNNFLCRNELEEFCKGLQHYSVLELIRMHAPSFRSVFVHGEAVQEDVSANYIIDTFLPQFSNVA
jgi:hypothetical protein